MKQEINNEMDLLLRQLARRQGVFAPGAEDHLDADELSAYAENSVPAKARTRYIAHLAECSRCRDLVVQLTASAGVVIAEQTEKVSGPSVWRKFLASLLSPMVLRYAAPALGLIVVAAIGFVVLRSNRPGDYVSQVQNEQARPAGVAGGLADSDKQPGTYNDSPSKTIDSVNKEVPAKNSPQLSPTPVPQGTRAVVEQSKDSAKAPEPKPEAQPVVAAEAPPPAAKVDTLNVSDEKRQQNKDMAQKQEAEVKVTAAEDSTRNFEAGKVAKLGEPATARARAAKRKTEINVLSGAATGAAAPASTPREEAGRDDKDKESSAETRSVAGRRFRKQGGVWIDTAYESPRATMDLNRGSEAYRSLIADEPTIKTIADELDGEIIVVWKGRNYHIR